MQEITAQNLESVAGGTHKNNQVTQTLTQIRGQISSLASSNASSSSSTTTMLMLALAMGNRSQTVIAAPGGCSYAAPSGFFRFRARIRF